MMESVNSYGVKIGHRGLRKRVELARRCKRKSDEK